MSFLKLPHGYLNLPDPTLRLCMISPPPPSFAVNFIYFSFFIACWLLLIPPPFPLKNHMIPLKTASTPPPLSPGDEKWLVLYSTLIDMLSLYFLLETKSISVWMWSTQTILQTWWRMANYNYPYRLSLPTMILPNSPTLSVLLRNLIRRWSHSR